MKSDLTIWPLSFGTINNAEKSNFTYGRNHGEKITSSSIVYLIKGGSKNILVDTGMSDPEWASKYHYPSIRTKSQEPTAAVENLGVAVEQIDIVILTHLHWDHCFNNDLFANAQIFVQKEEIQYALFPLPIHNLFYESFAIGMTPVWLKDIGRFTVVEGDLEIVPGVSVLRLPGHTPGFQGVLVKTKKGNQIIAGDLCPLYENWPVLDKEPIPPGIHVNLIDCYDSFKRLRNLADSIFPGHDPRVLELGS